MPDRTALLFPSQGSYLPEVLRPLAAAHPAVGDVLTAVDHAATQYGCAPVTPVLLQPRAPSLEELLDRDPETLQLAIFATSLAVHTVITEVHGVQADVLVGHSMGEVTALVAAGVYTVGDGAGIICLRSRAMRDHGGSGSQVAVGLSAERTAHLLGVLALDDLQIAAVNGPRQTVVSGTDDSVDLLSDAASAIGVAQARVPWPYLSHNHLMAAAAQELGESVALIPASPLHGRIYSPVYGRFLRDEDDFPQLIAGHLTRTVDFLGAVRWLHARGCDTFVEGGAGRVLTNFVHEATGLAHTVALLDQPVDLTGFEAAASTLPGFRPDSAAATSPLTAAPEPGADDLEPARAATGPTALPEWDELLAELRRMYAEETEAPEDLIEFDMDLESELGVDSLTQLSLFARAARRYGRAEPPKSLRITDYSTLADLADLLRRMDAA
ncbi:acyltransferase domain-containing protein [Streptomyces poriticola]|uniref:acyltransferase domain-containing protein n=1 Tax=Streptomyces poriticola TaxID=3120506 RepID=UPI002FCDFCC2